MTHKKKGCTSTNGDDSSSSVERKMAEDIEINAKVNQNKRVIRSTKTKNMTNYKW